MGQGAGLGYRADSPYLSSELQTRVETPTLFGGSMVHGGGGLGVDVEAFVDVDDPDVGVADGDLSSESLLDVVGPQHSQNRAFFLEGFDQFGEAFAAGVLGGIGAELAEKVAGALLPADGSACGDSLGEVEPHEVAPPVGE